MLSGEHCALLEAKAAHSAIWMQTGCLTSPPAVLSAAASIQGSGYLRLDVVESLVESYLTCNPRVLIAARVGGSKEDEVECSLVFLCSGHSSQLGMFLFLFSPRGTALAGCVGREMSYARSPLRFFVTMERRLWLLSLAAHSLLRQICYFNWMRSARPVGVAPVNGRHYRGQSYVSLSNSQLVRCCLSFAASQVEKYGLLTRTSRLVALQSS